MILAAFLLAAAALAVLLAFGERLLLGWYVWEIRRARMAELPGEAVISYPLA